MEKMDLIEIISAARNEIPADLLLKNANVVNVFSGEVYPDNVIIHKGYIAGFGSHPNAKKVIDLKGQYLFPGFIDGHVHIESSMVSVSEYARTVVSLGTTSVMIDPHEISNVLGSAGISYMLKSSKYSPVNVYLLLPSCVPATDLETSGAELKAVDLLPFLSDKWVLGIGEMMNYPGVINKDPEVMDKICIADNAKAKIDGHAPKISGSDLQAYVSAGIGSEHECSTEEEAMERLRLGMYIMVREGSSARNLKALLPLVNDANIHRFIFVTDDRTPADLLGSGHINNMVRYALKQGLSPAMVARLSSTNACQYFGIPRMGAIAPGYYADLVVMDNLKDANISMVFKNGELVSKEGQLIYDISAQAPIKVRGSINIRWLDETDFHIKADKEVSRAHIIGIIPDQIVTEHLTEEVTARDGLIHSDVDRDLLKIVVIERHNASGNIGKGLVKGFGLKKGAIASSVAHDSHNIVIIGTNDLDMLNAAIQIRKMQGGLAISVDGNIVESLPLPIAGLMSDEPLLYVRDKLEALTKVAHELGVNVDAPFGTLSFLSLPVIPSLKVTDKGIVDVEKFHIIPLLD